MDSNNKPDPGDFAGYLQSIVQLNSIEKITQNLDSQLTDSQRVMIDIQSIFDSVAAVQNTNQEPSNNYLRYDDMSKFLDADPPKLLLPDMVVNNVDVDLDNVIAIMKCYAEDLKKNFVQGSPQSTNKPCNIISMELEHYASSLDQLCKRMANIKLNKGESVNKNLDLETKMAQLCEDVNMFTQMVQAKTTLSEHNRNWSEALGESNSALYYDSIINKLLSGINEVSYLLQNKNL